MGQSSDFGLSRVRKLSGHTAAVYDLQWSPDGLAIASASRDGQLRIWSADTGMLQNKLGDDASWLRAVAWSFDGRFLASGSRDQTVRIWALEGNECQRYGHGDWVECVTWSPNRLQLVSACRDGQLWFWDHESGRLSKPRSPHKHRVSGVDWSPDGGALVSCSYDQTVRIWDPQTRNSELLARLPAAANSVVWSSDSRYIAVGCADQTVRILNPQTGRQEYALEDHSAEVYQVCFSRDGTMLASLAKNGVACLRCCRTWERLGEVKTSKLKGKARGVAFDPIGDRLATLREENRVIQIWDYGQRRREDLPLKKKLVFLSYCRDNAKEAARLRRDLSRAGHRVWWDQEILGGQDWKLEIRRALGDSYAVIFCLSEEIESRLQTGVYPEILLAIETYRTLAPGTVFLIPVRFSACEIPQISIDDVRTLDRLQYIDFFPGTHWASSLRRLTTSLDQARQQWS